MSFEWDEFKQTGEWITFKEIGDTAIGDIVSIRTGEDFNGKACPELIIKQDDGEHRTITAGQVMLKSELAEQAPQVGDRIRIVYSGNGEGKPGKAPAKLFDVAIRAKDPSSVPPPAPVAAANPAPEEAPF